MLTDRFVRSGGFGRSCRTIISLSMISGANNISNQRTRVDELNVFPVPDGDTGTNMSMTIGAACR